MRTNPGDAASVPGAVAPERLVFPLVQISPRRQPMAPPRESKIRVTAALPHPLVGAHGPSHPETGASMMRNCFNFQEFPVASIATVQWRAPWVDQPCATAVVLSK